MAASTKTFFLPVLSRNPLAAFLQGAGLPFRGLDFLLSRPRLWPLVAIPLALNLALFAGLLFGGGAWFADRLREWIGVWEQAAWYAKILLVGARLFFWVAVLLAVYFVFTPIALLIAAPFNDRIAEHAERACGFRVQDKRGLARMAAGEVLYVLASECKRLLAFGALFLALFVLNVVPVLGNAAYAAAGFGLASFAAAFEFASYAADRRHFRFREKWRFLCAHLAPTLGFGIVTALLFMIPFVNVFVVSVSAAGGAFLFCMMRGRE